MYNERNQTMHYKDITDEIMRENYWDCQNPPKRENQKRKYVRHTRRLKDIVKNLTFFPVELTFLYDPLYERNAYYKRNGIGKEITRDELNEGDGIDELPLSGGSVIVCKTKAELLSELKNKRMQNAIVIRKSVCRGKTYVDVMGDDYKEEYKPVQLLGKTYEVTDEQAR